MSAVLNASRTFGSESQIVAGDASRSGLATGSETGSAVCETGETDLADRGEDGTAAGEDPIPTTRTLSERRALHPV